MNRGESKGLKFTNQEGMSIVQLERSTIIGN